jgi:hypothetical protein
MKTVLASLLSPVEAKIADVDAGNFSVTMASGRSFVLPASPPADDPPAEDKLSSTSRGVARAAAAFAELDRTVQSVVRDERLSTVGRDEKLAEPRANALRQIAAQYESGVIAHRLSTDELEAQRYRPPEATSANYLRERHVLDLVLGAKPDQHPAIMRHLLDAEDEEAILALQRAPKIMGVLLGTAKFGDETFASLASTAWRALKDKRDPAGKADLILARAQAEWGERAFGHIAGQMMLAGRGGSPLSDAMRNDRAKLFELTGRAHKLFSISDDEAARFTAYSQRTAR